ncbi:MAG: hypothetical protein R6T89_04005 [Candidatus Syntrophosphaera sp.]
MKRVLIILVLMIPGLLLFGQEISSFRNLGTCGVLDDDADLAFDPIELNYLEGTNIFTNLSNFSRYDRIYANEGANRLTIGLSTDKCLVENLKRALLFSYYDVKTPNDINFYTDPNSENAQTAFGEIEHTWEEFYDTNGNMLYDMHHSYFQHYQNVDHEKGWNIFLNHAYEISPQLRAGAKLGYMSWNSGHNRSSSNLLDFSHGDYSTHILETQASLPDSDPGVDSLLIMEEITGDFGMGFKENTFQAELAVASQMEKGEISASLLFEIFNSEMETDDAAEYWFTSLDEDEFELESQNDVRSQNGWYAGLGLGYRKILVEAEERKNEGYLSVDGRIGYIGMAAENSEVTTASYDYDGLETGIWEQGLEEKGDQGGFDLGALIRLNYPLNQRTFFGTGLNYHFQSQSMDGEFIYFAEAEESEYLEEGEWLSTVASTWEISGDTRHEVTASQVVVPAGLEYWFANNMKWALRFGSVFTQTSSTGNRTFEPTNSEPQTTTYTSAANPDPVIEYSENTYEMESEHTTTRESETSFCYGLGYKPSENLQIDLMGMFDVESVQIWNTQFFRSLRISFSLRL